VRGFYQTEDGGGGLIEVPIQKMEKTPETYDCHHKSTMDNRSRGRNFTV
jgi:hypothetical protein